MKKILFIIILVVSGGMLTSCEDLTTDLDIETNTRLVYFVSNPYSNLTAKYIYTWQAGQDSHTLDYEVAFSGLESDKPIQFKLIQTNFAPDGAAETVAFQYGVADVTWKDEIFEIPAGQKSATISIKFIKDPYHVETTNLMLKYYGWNTVFEVVLVNDDEVDSRWVGTKEIYVQEKPIP